MTSLTPPDSVTLVELDAVFSHPAPEGSCKRLPDLGLDVAEETRASAKYLDVDADTAEEVGHLGGDVAAAYDNQALGGPLEVPDVPAREVGHLSRPFMGGISGRAPENEEDVLRLYLLACDRHPVVARELPRARVVGEGLDPATLSSMWCRSVRRYASYASMMALEVDLVDRRLDAEGGGALYLLDDVGGVDDHLARYAPPVEARAAELVLLDEGDPEPLVEGTLNDGHARARADDEDVEALHGSGSGAAE